MPESTRKRSAAKAAAEPEPATPGKAAKSSKAADPGKADKAARASKAAAEPAPAAEPVPGKKAGKAARPAKAAEQEAPVAAEPVAAAGEDAGTGEADEFLNRAARRAKGRGRSGGAQPVGGRGPSLSGRGSVPGQRQWGNRRTGG